MSESNVTPREKKRRRRRNRRTTLEREKRRREGKKKVPISPGRVPMLERKKLSTKEKEIARLIAIERLSPKEAADRTGALPGYVETMYESWPLFQTYLADLRGERTADLKEETYEKARDVLTQLQTLVIRYRDSGEPLNVRQLKEAYELEENVMSACRRYDPPEPKESKPEKEEAQVTTYDLMLEGLKKDPTRYSEDVLEVMLLAVKEEDVKQLPDELKKKLKALDEVPELVRLRQEITEMRAERSELKKELRRLKGIISRRDSKIQGHQAVH